MGELWETCAWAGTWLLTDASISSGAQKKCFSPIWYIYTLVALRFSDLNPDTPSQWLWSLGSNCFVFFLPQGLPLKGYPACGTESTLHINALTQVEADF